jgi:uncharacterized protein YutE (UPF0331/DUF86 family)|uniref:DUF86 domain-containing protein n=1 Tax=candidate division WOR-3 bacterium TaxID=2052148 RepID=A0A7C3YST7_UNCW3
MDLDKKVIEARLRRLDRSVTKLKKFARMSRADYLANEDYQELVERNFQVAIQTCIDIANHIIAQENLPVPDEEENIFLILSKNNIIPKELGERIKGMVGFRNILVHEYLSIDHTLVYDLLQNRLSDFSDFAKVIVAYLEKG